MLHLKIGEAQMLVVSKKKLISFPSPPYVDKKKIRLILAQCMLVQCPAWSQVQQVRIHPPATTSRNASSTSGPPVSWKDKVEPVSSVQCDLHQRQQVRSRGSEITLHSREIS